MWRNDIKCKCMFMFSLKDLACKRLTINPLAPGKCSDIIKCVNFKHTQASDISFYKIALSLISMDLIDAK